MKMQKATCALFRVLGLSAFLFLGLTAALAQDAGVADENGSTVEQPSENSITPVQSETRSDLVTINLRNVSIYEVLRAFSLQTGQSIVVGPEVNSDKVNVQINKRPWPEALDAVLKPLGYGYKTVGDTITVSSLANLRIAGGGTANEEPGQPVSSLANPHIAGVSHDDITPIRLDRVFGMKQWEFTITAMNLSRVDIRLLLGEEELLHTWHTDFGTKEVSRLDVVIDFLDDLNVNKWRFFSAVEGQSGWFNRLIQVPEWAYSRNLHMESMSSTPGPRGDNRFQLMRMSYDDGKMKKTVPLYLQIMLNGEPIPINTSSTAWPPVVDPTLTTPPRNLSPELVARAFGYPNDLKMSEVTDWRDSSFPGIPLWALSFSSETNTFAGVHIVGFQKGTFLTPEMETKLAKALEEYTESISLRIQDEKQRIDAINDPAIRDSRARENEDMKAKLMNDAPIRILDGSWGSKAYVQIMAFGPGGVAFGYITTSPTSRQDVMILTSVSGEGVPRPADSVETHEYYLNMRERPLDLLTTAGQLIAAEIFESTEGPTKGSTRTGDPLRGSPSGQP